MKVNEDDMEGEHKNKTEDMILLRPQGRKGDLKTYSTYNKVKESE
jgi:hypothetical protein